MKKSLSALELERQAGREIPRLVTQWTGLEIKHVEKEADLEKASGRADFLFQLNDLCIVVEVKAQASLGSVTQAARQVRSYAESLQSRGAGVCKAVLPLVVVPYMTPSCIDYLKKEGISWVDLSGNASIHAESPYPIHVWIEGKPNQFPKKGRPSNLFAPKASRLTRFLLVHPGASFSQRELSEKTGLDEGYISRLVRQLEAKDLLIRDAEGAVRPRDYDLLLDAWVAANAYRHKPLKGHLSARSGEELTRRIARALEEAGVDYAATGLAAAWAYTHAASFRKATLYIRQMPPEAVLDVLGFREESNAPNVTFLLPDDEGVFMTSRSPEGFCCVAPVQAYVDLKHEAERADELAEVLRTQQLTWS